MWSSPIWGWEGVVESPWGPWQSTQRWHLVSQGRNRPKEAGWHVVVTQLYPGGVDRGTALAPG